MLLGKVIGTVVSSQKDPQLEGLVFQVLQVLDMNGKPANNYVVAIDAVGAGTDVRLWFLCSPNPDYPEQAL